MVRSMINNAGYISLTPQVPSNLGSEQDPASLLTGQCAPDIMRTVDNQGQIILIYLTA